MDEIIEIALRDIIRRLDAAENKNEILEKRLNKFESVDIKETPKPQGKTTGTSSEGQLKYIRQLGGNPDSSWSKQQASDEIDRLLKIKQDRKIERECENIVEPPEVDTDDVGIDEEGFL